MRLIEIPVADGSVLVEVPGTTLGQGVAMSTDRPTLERAEQSLEASLQTVERLSEAVAGSLKRTGAQSAEISLGLKFTAKGSIFVAETSAEATLNLKITFRNSP